MTPRRTCDSTARGLNVLSGDGRGGAPATSPLVVCYFIMERRKSTSTPLVIHIDTVKLTTIAHLTYKLGDSVASKYTWSTWVTYKEEPIRSRSISKPRALAIAFFSGLAVTSRLLSHG
uniref:Uncharacterized protein n=1 Tax=Leersia perrieri TaxID=77586 RepID=A0A0D9WEW2_9ORYZ